MIKSLASFGLLLGVLAASAQACTSPTASQTQATQATQAVQERAEAQATNVRRTAVADVQRIIANNPAATATPPATPLARPSCQNAIWWHEARSHIGESLKVQGTVVATRPAPDGLALVEIGQPYPDPTGLAVLLPAAAAPSLAGKTVCVTGRITNAEGRATMLLRDAAGIAPVN